MIVGKDREEMKKQHYNGQWFLIPVIGIKRCDLWFERVYQYNLCLAWLNFGIDIKICKKSIRKNKIILFEE